MKIKAIITGVTGMVGEGVLHICLNHPDVESVLVISRKPCGVQHPKLKEIIHANFQDISSLKKEVTGYNACYFCSGVSSAGMKEEQYRKLTYDLTLGFAGTLAEVNPDMTFCYISGSGTDSTEKGKMMWARVKGKTENDLMKLPFRQVYAFRPGGIQPLPGMKHTYTTYKVLAPLIPVLKFLMPGIMGTLEEIGLAMIHSVTKGYPKKVLEVKDIRALAGK
ncbi:MAG: NAD-dependent epimerase/dehydratase family protein [Bacteroidetes bacterium]|nr:NAD-dependent epimerase/dehydratase family protein [Bacteroidota bacterium]